MYVYIKGENNDWWVGFYPPKGDFCIENQYTKQEDAAQRVHYLNGGN